MTIHLHYGPATETTITQAIQAAVKRGDTPTVVCIPEGVKLDIEAVDGVPVVEDKKVLPITHFWVVV